MHFEAVTSALLERCRNGDSAAFNELCAAMQQGLYGFVFSMLRSHDDTDEVVQECLVRIYRFLPGLDSLEKFPGWVTRMAVNQCNTFRSRRAAQQLLPLEEGLEPAREQIVGAGRPPQSPREAAVHSQLSEAVNLAMTHLPPKQQAAIVMFEVHEMSIREIAEALECSEGVVKFNLHEARKKLRENLRPFLAPAQPAGGAS